MAARVERDRVNSRMVTLAKRDQIESSQQRQIDELIRRNKQQSVEKGWLWTVLIGSILLLSITVFFLRRLRHAHQLLKTSNTQLFQSREEVRLLNIGLEQRVQDRVDELRASEKRMRLFFERQLVGMAITSPGKGWIEVNDKMCEMLGYSREELAQLTWAELTYPEDLATNVAQFERMLSGEIDGYMLEKRFVRKDGRLVFTKLAVACVRREEQSVDYVLAMLVDITERKQMEEELLKREQEFRALAENSPDTIARYDRECRRIYINPALAKLGAKAADAMLGITPINYYSSPEAIGYENALRHALESGNEGTYELTCPDFSGRLITRHIRIIPEFGIDERVVCVLAIGRDISERKAAEAAREDALAEAMHLAKTRSEFLAHMSHELRTPLNGILGYTQILQRDQTLSARNADALNVICQSGEHLLSLVEDILDLARIEAGRFKLDLGDISLATLLRVVVGIVRIRVQQKGLEFITDVAADLPAGIRGDDKRLRQVLLNLLSNAVKFTEHGKVVLHVRRTSPSRIAFAIEDTGIGIAANELESIFQPFEQSGDAQQRFGGAGLGLSISRQLVRLMGGNIEVESSIGKGSTFRFELELPDVEIDLAGLLPLSIGKDQAESTYVDEDAVSLILPSAEEIKDLYCLAQLGNMRDIILYAERISVIDPRYQPFAARLRLMAEGFQSKAILTFVERYLHDSKN